jgi:hypothetical protein
MGSCFCLRFYWSDPPVKVVLQAGGAWFNYTILALKTG